MGNKKEEYYINQFKKAQEAISASAKSARFEYFEIIKLYFKENHDKKIEFLLTLHRMEHPMDALEVINFNVLNESGEYPEEFLKAWEEVFTYYKAKALLERFRLTKNK